MSRAFWGMLLGIALASESASAQEAPPTGPVSVTTLPHPQLPDAPPATGSPDASLEDRNGPLIGDSPVLLMQGPAPIDSWFTDVEVDFLKPHFVGFLNGPVNFGGGFTDTVELPNAPLDWTVSPHLEIGYRLPVLAASSSSAIGTCSPTATRPS